jgi:hypothetical protein
MALQFLNSKKTFQKKCNCIIQHNCQTSASWVEDNDMLEIKEIEYYKHPDPGSTIVTYKINFCAEKLFAGQNNKEIDTLLKEIIRGVDDDRFMQSRQEGERAIEQLKQFERDAQPHGRPKTKSSSPKTKYPFKYGKGRSRKRRKTKRRTRKRRKTKRRTRKRRKTKHRN